MDRLDLRALRRRYRHGRLEPADLDPDPLRQFRAWLDEAVAADLLEPTAMTLATADAAGRPAARMVLLKELDARGFVFFTNYDSRKGRELAANPRAALLFWWAALERQVRIEGAVERTSREASEAYFRSRPRGSRLGALASPQSRPLASREELEARVAELAASYPEGDGDGREIPRPEHWGGYRLVPDALEFWQGRDDRLHDRVLYRQDPEGTWTRTRLAP